MARNHFPIWYQELSSFLPLFRLALFLGRQPPHTVVPPTPPPLSSSLLFFLFSWLPQKSTLLLQSQTLKHIYGTISPSLLKSIVCPDDSAFDAWTRITNNFQNNKTSCILDLESQFNEISLTNFSNVKTYCNALENIATSLNNLGTSIINNRLALQVLHGLTTDYRTFRALVPHMSPVPCFDTLRSMLELKEHSHNKDKSSTHDSTLITSTGVVLQRLNQDIWVREEHPWTHTPPGRLARNRCLTQRLPGEKSLMLIYGE
ncbi:uncharacterized protein LOC130826535 [Amaranthus tricolor]|uniref:uncharacterized protein LOC130826535 n=1 Tax=Amaranthus tricolor TaxID=29722 RepID=UPI002582E9D0|nr:uncharacterized protein LOC130826535 [Amaranthus tricolor]